MKRKHDVFFGFAVMIIAAIFTLAGCDNGTGQSFKSRYDEAISAGRYSTFALKYAPSTHSLQTFRERFEQARGTKNYEYSLAYASSTHSFQTFNNRYDEAIGTKNYEYSLAYASSTHSFQTFNNRYDEAIGAGNSSAYSRAYAKSRYSP